MKEWLVTMTSTSLAASRARSTKHSATSGHLPPMHSWAETDTCRQARSETPGTSSSRSPESVLRRPLAQPDDLLAEPADRGVDLPDREQAVLVVGEAALELVEAHVVAPALDERVGRAAPEDRREGVGDARHVAVDDLGLQRQRRGRDDGRLARLEGVGDRRARGRRATCRCRCRPARAGARPSSIACATALRHLDLPRPLGAADSRHRGVEEVVERGSLGHWIRVCRRTGAPPPWAPDLWTGACRHPVTVGPNSLRGARPIPVRGTGRRELYRGHERTPAHRPRDRARGDPAPARRRRRRPRRRATSTSSPTAATSPRSTSRSSTSPRRAAHGAKYVVVTAMTPTPARRGQDDDLGRARPGAAAASASAPSSRCVSRRWDRRSASRAARPAAATARSCRWSGSTCTSPATSTPSPPPTTCSRRWSTTTCTTATTLGIDVRNITWRRVLDVNDRALRNVVIGLGARQDGLCRARPASTSPRRARSWCCSPSPPRCDDLRERLGRIVVGYTDEGKSVTAEDLHAAGAMAAILEDALKPNLLQTLEGGPAIIHCGPFGNIATGHVVGHRRPHRHARQRLRHHRGGLRRRHGRRALLRRQVPGQRAQARRRRRRGHGARAEGPLGALCRPSPASPCPRACSRRARRTSRPGCPTCASTSRSCGGSASQPVVAINAFPDDHDSEHDVIRALLQQPRASVRAVTRHVAEGGAGALELAQVVVEAAHEPTDFEFLYPLDLPLEQKIEAIATQIYGADGIDVSPAAARALKDYERLGYGGLPVVIAKTHLSISSDPTPARRAARVAACRCARCARRSAPATSTRSAATCARCRACRPPPTPSASTSPRTARSPASSERPRSRAGSPGRAQSSSAVSSAVISPGDTRRRGGPSRRRRGSRSR